MTNTPHRLYHRGQASPEANCRLFVRTLLFIWLIAASLMPVWASAQLEIDNRWMVRDFYNTVYFYGTDASMEWTGDYGKTAPGEEVAAAGTVSEEWLDATLVRINFFREMSGVPANVTFRADWNAKAQLSAMIQSGNGFLSHFPDSSSPYWTADGREASEKGNLALGTAGPDAVTGYMVDHGDPNNPKSNDVVGHRRWIFFPATEQMGSGGVPGDDNHLPANCIWVQDRFSPRPPVRDYWVAWPPAGFVPSNLVWSRWSFSHPGADFTNATVTMTSGPVEQENYTYSPNSFPESTLVWIPNGMSTTEEVQWPTPSGDEVVTVSIQNVNVGGQIQSFEYDVTIFDASAPGQGEYPTELSAPQTVTANVPASFTATIRPSWSEWLEGRILLSNAVNTTFDAENGFDPFLAQKSDTYDLIQNDRVSSGSSAYQLVHSAPSPSIQILEFPATYIIGGNSPRLEFDSSISYIGSGQLASVDIQASGDTNWESIWSTPGPVEQNVTSFSDIQIPLDAWAGTTARFRFRFDFVGGNYFSYPQPGFAIGWAFDNIAFTDVRFITGVTYVDPVQGDSFDATITTTDTVHLQAREYAFGGFPMQWGPLLAVTAEASNGYPVEVGTWSEDPLYGWIYGFSDNWIYSQQMGFLHMNAYPWVYSPGLGWLRYLQGNMTDGLWLYHTELGFIFTHEGYDQIFAHSPFDSEAFMGFLP